MKVALLFLFFRFSLASEPDAGLVCAEKLLKKIGRSWGPYEKLQADLGPVRMDRERGLQGKVEGTRLLPVPLIGQGWDYTCGVASKIAGAAAFGVHIREGDLAKLVESSEEVGTDYQRLVQWAKAQGFEVKVQFGQRRLGEPLTSGTGQKMGVEGLKAEIDQGRPVLVLVQAYAGEKNTDYTDFLENGHYVLVVGYTPDKLIIMDPMLVGNYGYIPQKEMPDRWHFLEGVDEMQDQFAISISHPNGFQHDRNLVLSSFDKTPSARLESFSRRIPVPLSGELRAGMTGVAALHSLLACYDVPTFQNRVAKKLAWKKNSDVTLSAKEYEAFLDNSGLTAQSGTLSSQRIESLVSNGKPVMLRLKGSSQKPRWVIAMGVSEDSFLLMDPVNQPNYSKISRETLRNYPEPLESVWINAQPTYDPDLVYYVR